MSKNRTESKYNIHLTFSQYHPDAKATTGWVCKYGITQRRELATTFTRKQVQKVLEHYHAENGGKLTYELDVIEVDPKPVER